jgi:hypothetical protein
VNRFVLTLGLVLALALAIGAQGPQGNQVIPFSGTSQISTTSSIVALATGSGTPSPSAGDIVAARTSTTGVYYAGTDGLGILFRNGSAWQMSAGGNFHFMAMVERGSCSMAAAATCTFGANASWVGTPLCFTEQTTNLGTLIGSSCAQAASTVTITASGSTTNTFNAFLIGNPN